MRMSYKIVFIFPIILLGITELKSQYQELSEPEVNWAKARENAELACEGFERSHRSMEFWLKQRVEPSGLFGDEAIPGNKRTEIWNVKNAAADNYPFLVLTAALTDSSRYKGELLDMLKSEIALTSRDFGKGKRILPDSWNIVTNSFANQNPDEYTMTFGVSEYCKDGLMPVSEWLGTKTPWYDRMIQVTDELWLSHTLGISDQGKPIILASENLLSKDNVEAHGEQLQILPRLYWATKDARYKEWAIRLGDHYLLGKNHPTRDLDYIKLRDHGNEIISGLTELYALLSLLEHSKADEYREPLYEMLDFVLKYGRNEDGLFHDELYPQNKTRKGRVADNFGYVYNAFYVVYMIDRNSSDSDRRQTAERYRREVVRGLENLDQEKYYNFKWEDNSSDGYADAIEGAINLNNRERLSRVNKWIDSEILVMWEMQGDKEYSQRIYPDGNFCRTSLMYCLWKTQGVHTFDWRKDLTFGAVETPSGEGIAISITANDADWHGELCFDQARHLTFFHMPMDYPRINSFPEWFTVDTNKNYQITEINNKEKILTGRELLKGLRIELSKGIEKRFVITENPTNK
jgi:hypothetical protein